MPASWKLNPRKTGGLIGALITAALGFGLLNLNLPIGITFQGRPYADAVIIKLAYAYEQATHHRKPPASVPSLRNP